MYILLETLHEITCTGIKDYIHFLLHGLYFSTYKHMHDIYMDGVMNVHTFSATTK